MTVDKARVAIVDDRIQTLRETKNEEGAPTSFGQIAETLNNEGLLTPHGNLWTRTNVQNRYYGPIKGGLPSRYKKYQKPKSLIQNALDRAERVKAAQEEEGVLALVRAVVESSIGREKREQILRILVN